VSARERECECERARERECESVRVRECESARERECESASARERESESARERECERMSSCGLPVLGLSLLGALTDYVIVLSARCGLSTPPAIEHLLAVATGTVFPLNRLCYARVGVTCIGRSPANQHTGATLQSTY
jgi:hypothetical protein